MVQKKGEENSGGAYFNDLTKSLKVYVVLEFSLVSFFFSYQPTLLMKLIMLFLLFMQEDLYWKFFITIIIIIIVFFCHKSWNGKLLSINFPSTPPLSIYYLLLVWFYWIICRFLANHTSGFFFLVLNGSVRHVIRTNIKI